METLDLYDFALPEELIATRPLPERSASRLLVLKRDLAIEHDRFINITRYLKTGDVLVINNTKVRRARIKTFKKSGGKVEILLVRPLSHGNWAVLINGKGPFLPDTELLVGASNADRKIKVLGKDDYDKSIYHISCDFDLGKYSETDGELPLPPYFRRQADHEDYIRYQTIYAKELGAVAAPTAGLHFTDDMISQLKQMGIDFVEVTLHVGPGTFLPIRTQNVAEHSMHAEFFHLHQKAADRLNQAKKNRQRIIAVGTTSLRVLEQTMQWAQGTGEFFPISQETSIFIRPGYQFLACNALITNFHLPRSTLILLVSAAYGRERILKAYHEAILHKYRFFSYGDACFIEIGSKYE